MNTDTRPMYWMTNKKWYTLDKENDRFVLTEEATEEAKESFELYKKINNLN